MGIGDRLRSWFYGAEPTTSTAPLEPTSYRFQSYQPLNVLIEGLMHGIGRVGRTEALSVPAVLRGRNMICSLSTLPLIAVDQQNRNVRHRLLAQFDPNVPNVVTLAQTLEDLLFEAVAWWRITEFDAEGYPVSIRRYAPGDVSMNAPTNYREGYLPSELPTRGRVWMGGEPVSWEQVIRFDSPNPALLVAGQRPIKRALLLDKAADLYANSPRRRGYFTPVDGVDPSTDDDVQNALNAWAEASRSRVDGYVPAALTYNAIQDSTPAELQLVQMQERVTLDLANALGIDPEDLGMSTTSRTYQNATDRRQDRINDTLSPYMSAITDRLTMPDVTKRNTRVRWDLRQYLRADPRTRAEVQRIYFDMGATDAAEIRQDESLPPRTITRPAPANRPTDTAAASLAGSGPARVRASWGPPLVTAGDDPAAYQLEPAHTFAGDGPTELTFDTSGAEHTFAVDLEARTVTGLIVPWGQYARSGGRTFRFARGSIKWKSLSRVKLLRDHSNALALGRATRIWEDETGLWGQFSVARGRLGDEALALAQDGVLDGLSVGADFRLDVDTRPDPRRAGAHLVVSAAMRETSLTAVPAFDDSRLTSVRAARDTGDTMHECEHCHAQLTPGVAHTCTPPTATPPAPTPATFTLSADQFAALFARGAAPGTQPDPDPEPPAEPRPTVDPTHTPVATVTADALPYKVAATFNRITGGLQYEFSNDNEHVFSADLAAMARARDNDGTHTEAGQRVMALLRHTFAEVTSSNVSTLNPAVNRPDMYVDQRDYRTPLMDLIGKGAPPNGIQPFLFPKFSSASGLVGDHTEGVEPASGSFAATSQTVTPTPISGKASITREVWDMGGNPAVSGLIFNQMVRGYREGLETAAATFLNTLTAATDIALTAGAANDALAAEIEAALAGLQFTRGYNFEAFVMEQGLYTAIAGARDDAGRPLYPILNPSNANGTAAARFRTLNVAGLVGIPSWALTATVGAVNNSWIFDPTTVYGWWTAPQRLEFPGSDPGATSAPNAYAPVAYVDLAIWGYKAFANSDIAGVRQVTYDETA